VLAKKQFALVIVTGFPPCLSVCVRVFLIEIVLCVSVSVVM